MALHTHGRARKSAKRSKSTKKRKSAKKRSSSNPGERPFAGMLDSKIRKVLKDGTLHGRPLTSAQKAALHARLGERT